MAEPTYVIETWADLDMYTCVVPDAGGVLHGWQAFTPERMTEHLLQEHGVTEAVGALVEVRDTAVVEDTGEEE